MPVTIDRRNIWVIVGYKLLRLFIFIFLAVSLYYINTLPESAALTASGKNAIAVFFVCLFLWTTNLLPIAVTSILAIVLVPLLEILPRRDAYALFGNEAVFFILGAFILAGAVLHSGLSNRIALTIITRFGSSPKKLLISILSITTVMSLLMSEHAVAAMLFPIVLQITQSLELTPGKSNYGKLLFLSLAWGCVIGGVGTFLGGARVPLAVGILNELTGETISFLQYTIAVFPLVIVLFIFAFFLITKVYPIDIDHVEKAKEDLQKRINVMGKVSFNEYSVGAILLITVFFWVFFGSTLGLATIALTSVVVLFIFRLVRWKEIEDYVSWGVIIMYGGAIVLGTALERSGAASFIADLLLGDKFTSTFALLAALSLLTLVLTEGISNAAVIAILLPVAIGFAPDFGVSATIITFAIAVPAGLAFSLPLSTPANAIAISSNYIKVSDMVRAGVIMSVISWIVFNLLIRFYWPLIGMNI